MPTKINMELRVVVYPDDGDFIAHCLEMDVVAQGGSPLEALKELAILMTMQVEEAVRLGDIKQAFRPAPAEYWEMFNNAKEIESTPDQSQPAGYFERMIAREFQPA